MQLRTSLQKKCFKLQQTTCPNYNPAKTINSSSIINAKIILYSHKFGTQKLNVSASFLSLFWELKFQSNSYRRILLLYTRFDQFACAAARNSKAYRHALSKKRQANSLSKFA
jgi:hypothetical protein